MTNFNPADLDWTAGRLAGWTYEKPVNKWFQGAFRHAHRLTRACPTCSEAIVLDVTTKALENRATNHGLALRRCKKCRVALKAGPETYAARKAETATVLKPEVIVVAAPVQTPLITAQELDELRMANATMKEELDYLYAYGKEMREKLAAYELGPALAASQAAPKFVPPVEKTVQMPQYIGENAVKPPFVPNRNKSQKMPWDA